MKKFFNKAAPQNFKEKGAAGQVKNAGRSLNKLLGAARRVWGLAARLEHIRNRGKKK